MWSLKGVSRGLTKALTFYQALLLRDSVSQIAEPTNVQSYPSSPNTGRAARPSLPAGVSHLSSCDVVRKKEVEDEVAGKVIAHTRPVASVKLCLYAGCCWNVRQATNYMFICRGGKHTNLSQSFRQRYKIWQGRRWESSPTHTVSANRWCKITQYCMK